MVAFDNLIVVVDRVYERRPKASMPESYKHSGVIIDSELSMDPKPGTSHVAVFISFSSCAVYGNHFPPTLAVL